MTTPCFIILDITNSSGGTPPKLLPVVFNSEKAASLYIRLYGSPGCEVKPAPLLGLDEVKLLSAAMSANKKVLNG